MPVVLAMMSAICCASAAFATPVDEASIWLLLDRLTPDISSSRVLWSRTLKSNPKPTDASLRAAAASDFVKTHGGTAGQAVAEAGVAAREAFRASAGTTQVASLNFLYTPQTTRCEVTDFASKLMTGAMTSDPTAYDVDILDDHKSVSISGFNRTGAMVGDVHSATRGGLFHSALRSGDLQFLVGSPIINVFDQKSSSIGIDVDGNIVIHKLLTGAQDYNRIATVTISKVTGYPVEMDETYQGEKSVRMRYVASQFHHYGSGITFPSVVTVTHYAIDGSITSEEDYSLQKATFNAPVQPKELYSVNPGSSIRDDRFGIPVTYKVQSSARLPSDEKVLSFVNQFKESLRKQHRHNASNSFTSHVYMLSSILVLTGILLWLRGRNGQVSNRQNLAKCIDR